MSDWKLKVQQACLTCMGDGYDCDNVPCDQCNGTGKVKVEVHPEGIEKFLRRKASVEFKCICGKKEVILRPIEGQIPSGWLNWDGSLICNDCKYKVMFAALRGAALRIQQIKESSDSNYSRQDDSFHC